MKHIVDCLDANLQSFDGLNPYILDTRLHATAC